MGLKGYRLWVMGQLDSTCRAPPLNQPHVVAAVRFPRPKRRLERGARRAETTRQEQRRRARAAQARCSAARCVLERQTLKPVFPLDRLQVMGLKGYRLWAMGQLDATCRAPPRLAAAASSPRRPRRRPLCRCPGCTPHCRNTTLPPRRKKSPPM